MFRNTGANAFAKNPMRLAYEDKRDLYCTYICTHKNSNVIPALSEFQSDKDRQEALVGPRIIQFSGILGK